MRARDLQLKLDTCCLLKEIVPGVLDFTWPMGNRQRLGDKQLLRQVRFVSQVHKEIDANSMRPKWNTAGLASDPMCYVFRHHCEINDSASPSSFGGTGERHIRNNEDALEVATKVRFKNILRDLVPISKYDPRKLDRADEGYNGRCFVRVRRSVIVTATRPICKKHMD